MSRVAFILAIPHGKAPGGLPELVPEPREVLGTRPAIWLSSGTPVMMALGQMVIGIVFTSDGRRCRIGASPPREPDEFARDMIERCWGAYFAILPDRQTDEVFLLPDPSGLLPVYRLTTGSHVVLTSHPALLKRELGLPIFIDYKALAAHLLQPELRQAGTCLAELHELEPGTLVNLTGRAAPPKRLWSPVAHIRGRDNLSLKEYAAGLRDVGTRVMRCWSSVLGEPAVAISGGVDSSFICAALANSATRFGCTTLATTDASGDERYEARKVASAFDRPIAERFYDVALFDPAASASLGLPRPSRRLFQTVVDQLLIASQHQHGCAVTLDGNGGDNLFCLLHSSAPLLDRTAVEGPGVGALRTMIDLCAITGCSLTTVLAAAIRRSLRRTRDPAWSTDTRLLSPETHDLRGKALTSWSDLPDDILSGKREHVALIMRAQNHINGISAGIARFSPLASQPLVEFCLRVPTWLWSQGGKNRAVARASFSDLLPDDVLRRTSKAGPDSFIRQAFAVHRAQIAERLLDGLLLRNGLVDPVALEEALAGSELEESEDCLRVVDLLEAENWARGWA